MPFKSQAQSPACINMHRSPPPPFHHLNHRCLAISSQPSDQKSLKLSNIKLHSSPPPVSRHRREVLETSNTLDCFTCWPTSSRSLSAKVCSFCSQIKKDPILYPLTRFVSIISLLWLKYFYEAHTQVSLIQSAAMWRCQLVPPDDFS